MLRNFLKFSFLILIILTVGCARKGNITGGLKDTIAPKIIISKSIQNKDIYNQKEVRFTISDDFSGIKTFNGFLNDQWILFEYESKLKRIIHTFDDTKLLDGMNTLKLVVVDNVGNSTTFETQFIRSLKK